jgi:pyroglutamyl-peptidase
MPLSSMVEGLRVAVTAAWQTSVDVLEAGGQVS